MKTFGIIGYPLSHSFSQKYFTEKFKKEGITDTVFHNYPIKNISEVTNIINNTPSLKGLAVTIPYKKIILPFLAQSTGTVKQIKACNCIKVHNNSLHGFNTDVAGFQQSFIKQLQPHHKQALILGTGGAAAAVEFVLQQLHISYRFVSRSATGNALTYAQLDKEILHQHHIIINTTPLGTYPQINEAPAIPYQFITSRHYFFDLVYNPPLTKFLQLASAQGAAIQNGYEMLTIQAEENWKIWNG